MNYTIETAFCEDSTRQFLFNTEEKISSFLNDSKEDELTFEAMNSYQRMLIHLLVQHYQMSSKSLEEKYQKDSNQEENKSADQLKTVHIQKKKESRSPLLRLRDYLTKYQLQKHESLMKGGGIFRNTSNRNQIKNEEDVVVFKGRGKTRWKPEDYGNYRRENERNSQTGKNEKEVEYIRGEIYEKKEIDNKNEDVDKEQKVVNNEEESKSDNDKNSKEPPKDDASHKQTRMKMLQRINGILGANQNTRKQGEARGQDEQPKPKEYDIRIDKESSNKDCKRIGVTADGKSKDVIKKSDNFLPSVNHILVIYNVAEGLTVEGIEEILQNSLKSRIHASMQTPERGLLVFESERDAERALHNVKIEDFKLVKIEAHEKNKFGEIFSREYFDFANLRPKTNKSAAIRMINGHLKIK